MNKKDILGFVYVNAKNSGFSLIKVFQKTFSEISLFSDHDFNHLDHGHHYHYHCRDYHHYHHHGDYHYGHSYHYYHYCCIMMTINNIIITITFIIINIIIINIIITI